MDGSYESMAFEDRFGEFCHELQRFWPSNDFGLEVKMYGDLVKNTIKRTEFTSSRTV